MKKTLTIFWTIIIWIYTFFCSYLYINQKSMIYFPDNTDFEKCDILNDYKKENYNWTRFYLKEKSKNLIIHYHWNASSACENWYKKEVFEKTNNSIIFVEYSWYSNDNKEANIKNILNDVKNIKDYLEKNKYEKIMVYWRSLWTWRASYQANIWKVDKLVLITPYNSFTELVKMNYPIFPVSFLLTEKYDNKKWLENYKNELLIIHWTNDEVIPYELGKKLYDSLKTTKKDFLTIKWKWHNDLDTESIFNEKILNFIIN